MLVCFDGGKENVHGMLVLQKQSSCDSCARLGSLIYVEDGCLDTVFAGTKELPPDNGAHLLGSATDQWRAVLAASTVAGVGVTEKVLSDASAFAHDHTGRAHGASKQSELLRPDAITKSLLIVMHVL